jgi:hypothetical protein
VARLKPGSVNTAASASAEHAPAGEMFKRAAGIDIVNITS